MRKNLQIFAPPIKACTCKTTILQPRFKNTYFLFLSLLYSRNLLSNNRQHLNVYTIELIETCPSTRSKTELIHLFQELHIKTGFFQLHEKKYQKNNVLGVTTTEFAANVFIAIQKKSMSLMKGLVMQTNNMRNYYSVHSLVLQTNSALNRLHCS